MDLDNFRKFCRSDLICRGDTAYWVLSQNGLTSCGGDYECYGNLYGSYLPEQLYIWVCQPRNNTEREYLAFVLNEGMFSKAFITKDLDEGLENGFEINLDLPWTFVYAGMTCLREITSGNYGDPSVWGEFCKDKELAIAFNQNYRIKGEYIFREGFGEHRCFPSMLDLHKFLENRKLVGISSKPTNKSGFHPPRLYRSYFWKDISSREDQLLGMCETVEYPMPFTKAKKYKIKNTKENIKLIVESAFKEGVL